MKNTLLFFLFLSILVIPAFADINSGLVGHWTFDDGLTNPASTTAADSSLNAYNQPNSNNGSLVNGPTWVTGQNGGAVHFNGVNQYITVPSSDVYEKNMSNLTVSAWVKPVGNGYIMNIAGPGCFSWSLYFLNNHINFAYSIGAGPGADATIISNAVVNTGVWTYVTVIFTSATSFQLFINGNPDKQVTGIGPTLNSCSVTDGNNHAGWAYPLLIGAQNSSSGVIGNFFNGSIDEVRLYNRAISADELNGLATNQFPPQISNGLPIGNLPLGTSQATLSVTTDENATCKYGTVANTSYLNLPNTFSTTGGTTHTTSLNNLVSGGLGYTYYVRCSSNSTGVVNLGDYTIFFGIAGIKTVPGQYPTINACAAAAQPGDTCQIDAGTYHEVITPTVSGVNANPINFMAHPGDLVQVDGIDLDAVKNIWVQGLQFKSITQYGIEWDFDNYYNAGMFANGDYWVQGPVTILAMKPDWTGLHNGFEINPMPENTEPYDAGGYFFNAGIMTQDQITRTGLDENDAWIYQELLKDGYITADGHTVANFTALGSDFLNALSTRLISLAVPYEDPRYVNLQAQLQYNLAHTPPPMPYLASPTTSLPIISILKTLSHLQDPTTPITGYESSSCWQNPNVPNAACEDVGAVLTIVKDLPPDLGKTVFRPPYVGRTKPPYYSINDLQTALLPSLNPPAPTGPNDPAPPTLDGEFELMKRPQVEHLQGQSDRTGRPNLNQPSYGVPIAVNNGDAALRLMLNDPLAQKMPLLIAYVQGGIDRYQAAANGQNWPAGGGYELGEKISITFAAVLLNNQDMINFVKQGASIGAEDELTLGYNGMPLWGDFGTIQSTSPDQRYIGYWTRQITSAGNEVWEDPYYFTESGSSSAVIDLYQETVSGTYKGSAMAARLIPTIAQTWNNPNFFNYTDRWIKSGHWAQPDPCAPIEGLCADGKTLCTTQQEIMGANNTISGNSACPSNGACSYGALLSTTLTTPDNKIHGYGYSYGDDINHPGMCVLDPNLVQSPPPTMQSFSCQSGKVCGRYPDRHGAYADAGGISSFAADMWTTYRNTYVPPLFGDVSGDSKVSMYDAALTMRDVVQGGTCASFPATGSLTLSQQCASAEMDGKVNGQTDSADVVDIAKKALGFN